MRLLCATDAGGSANLIPLGEELHRRAESFLFLTPEKFSGNISQSWRHRVRLIRGEQSEEQLDEVISRENPSSLLVGTTRFVSPDRLLTRIARKRGIFCVAVLDDWSNYRRRFEDEKGSLVFLPDRIAVMDELAAREAAEDGLPESILTVTGSPALEKAQQRLPFARKEAEELRHRLGWESTPIATLLSEELAANFSDEPPESARVGPYLGFDENTVREDLLRALSRSGRSWILVEKLHPSSERSPADRPVAENVRLITVRDMDLVSLLLLSDKVVGMTSVALFIASMLGVDCISYQRGLVWKDLCAASRSGRVKRLDRFESLVDWLRRPALHVERQGFAASSGIPRDTDSSCEKILYMREGV